MGPPLDQLLPTQNTGGEFLVKENPRGHIVYITQLFTIAELMTYRAFII